MSNSALSWYAKSGASAQLSIIKLIRGVIKDSTKVRELILTSANHDSSDVRFEAFLLLTDYNTYDSILVSRVIDGILDNDEAVRELTKQILRHIPASLFEDEAIVTKLICCIESDHEDIRCNALWAIGNVGRFFHSAFPILSLSLKDSSELVRLNAIRAIERVGSHARDCVPVLCKLLQDEQSYIRRDCALALGSIGADATMAFPFLEVCLSDSEPEVQIAAANAMTLIDPTSEAPIPTLISHLERYGKDTAINAAISLKRLGKKNLVAIGPIIQAIEKEEDDEIRIPLVELAKSMMDELLNSPEKEDTIH